MNAELHMLLMHETRSKTPGEMYQRVYDRCAHLEHKARTRGNIYTNQRMTDEFIMLLSQDFFRSVVDFGAGNMAYFLSFSQPRHDFFLLFEDKCPERHYPMPTMHESIENLSRMAEFPEEEAHYRGSQAEMAEAVIRSCKPDYLRFIARDYPLKFAELRAWGLA